MKLRIKVGSLLFLEHYSQNLYSHNFLSINSGELEAFQKLKAEITSEGKEV